MPKNRHENNPRKQQTTPQDNPAHVNTVVQPIHPGNAKHMEKKVEDAER